MTEQQTPALTRADFKTDQDVRWCPGCGDYAILAAFQKVFPTLGIPREDFAIISGIGCSSRFPYYMNTYGFHTIHGRAPAFATGLKIARPELSVWVATGDGDTLSIGGNHFIHALRRNIGVKIVLFNNQIYGLTKGQFSPTSEFGKTTKSSPMGSVDSPFKPLALALGAEASFIARTVDRDPKHMASILSRTAECRGSAFVEVLQNCNIFNDGAFFHVTEKATKEDNQLRLVQGEPLVFGAEGNKGIVFDGLVPKVVQVDDVGLDQIQLHDEAGPLGYHMALAQMSAPDFPTPIGVIRSVERPAYEELVNAQVQTAKDKIGPVDIEKLLHSGDTWTV